LALYFFRRLQKFNWIEQLPAEWRSALRRRLTDNGERTQDMLREFRRINEAFLTCGVKVAALKGFTLVPDFCDELTIRHQTDFDFLVEPANQRAAAEALLRCGYETDHINETGETCFTTPMQHVPSTDDYLYALQHQRQVDLHISAWEQSPWLAMDTPQDCMKLVQWRKVEGAQFWSLALEDALLFQILHVFRHSLRSWIRLSWLLEIGQCMELHRDNTALWERVASRAGDTDLTKNAFAFVLGLVNRVFGFVMPSALQTWIAGADTAEIRTWLDRFAVDWATADWPGSLNNLFVTLRFIPDPALRRQYWRSRLVPRRENASLGLIAASNTKTFMRLQGARLRYLAQRAGTHAKDICGLPLQTLRWKRALAASRRVVVAINS
jgi:hypothetical protein